MPESAPDQLSARLLPSMDGRYRIERELGTGGMATVYLAEDLKHHRKVAIKVLHAELSAILGPERFLKEIELTANLQHPHILPLFDSGSADGLLFYVMPYVDGETLRGRLARDKQLPVADAVRIASETADALAYAHGRGIVHRDIKPENILLQNGHALVADFGIALAVQQAGGQRMTQTGLSLGTPQYMSPEQAMGERDIGPRSDIYSLGAVTYEMLSGDPPFTGSTAQAIVAQVITTEPRSLVAQRKSIPAGVVDAVMTALEKLPADRFASATEFSRALAGPTGSVTRATHMVPAGPHAGPRWLPWSIAALMTVIALAALAVSLRGRRGGTGPLVMSSLLPPDGQEFSERSSFGALSPDGQRFAFVLLSPHGESRLWLRRLDSLSAVALPGTDGAVGPFWSPDGKSIAFFAHDQLWRFDLTGGLRGLCKVAGGMNGSWADDGTILVASTRGIERTTANGGPCTIAVPIHTSTSSTELQHPVLLPDGKHVLFSVRFGSEAPGVFVADMNGGAWRQLVTRSSDPTFILPDILLYGAFPGAGMPSRLVAQRFDADRLTLSGDRVLIADGVRSAGATFSYSVSATGALAYLPSQGDLEKLVADRKGQIIDTIPVPGTWTHQVARSKPLVALGGFDHVIVYDMVRKTLTVVASLATSPVWGPGDSVLAGFSLGTKGRGAAGIHRVNLATGGDTLLVAGTRGTPLPTDWSRDGRYLLMTRAASNADTLARSELWAYDFTAGRPIRVLGSGGNVADGALSPDGRWLAYASDESGASEVYVRPFLRSGEAARISVNGGRRPRWRNDGREMYFETPDGRMMNTSTTPGVTLAFGTPQILFRVPSWLRGMFLDPGVPYDVNGDGTRFVLRMSPGSNAAVLVENWPALLRK
jgi:eukaryotic-like serine/threonine-protein kinase